MRLIDADRLKAAIHTDFSEHFTLYHDTDQTALFDMVMDDIDEMQTAFDKEKVIEELENLKAQYFITIVNAGDERLGFAYKYVWNALNHAIEIVEKGGIEA